jgi:lysyl-tRNA synthetase class 2
MSSERDERLELLEELNQEGNAFKYDYDREVTVKGLLDEYADKDEEDLPDRDFSIAGRVMETRNFGSLAFLDLRGEKGDIQVMIQDEDILDFVDEYVQNGDIVGVKGYLKFTQKGEFSIQAQDFELLTKGVRPIPSDFYGLEDQETRYRERPLHLISDLDARQVFRDRSKVISEMRHYLEGEEFMEVETPIIQPVYGGANAEPFTTYIEDKDMEAYLRIAPELYLKRLIIGGFERVFEIGKNFRNESIDTTHNPEYTAMELYQAYADYEDMMEITEEMIEHIAEEVTGSSTVEYDGKEIDLSAPWERMTMIDAIEEYGGFDVTELSDEEIREKMEEHGAELDSNYERGLAIAELFDEVAEEHLIQPVHIVDHPEETTPLCMEHREKEGMIERFESFIAGMEVSNAYTELRDPVRQRELFEKEEQRQEEGDDEAHPIDMDFVNALELGMPPTGGLGIGIDRIVMLMTDQESIRDVLLFPMMK